MLLRWRSSFSLSTDRYSGPGALQLLMIEGTSCRNECSHLSTHATSTTDAGSPQRKTRGLLSGLMRQKQDNRQDKSGASKTVSGEEVPGA